MQTDELPNDVVALKRIIVEIHKQSAAEIARLKAEQQAAIEEAVKAAVAAILRRYYGPRSEKFDPRQLLLFGELVVDSPLDTDDTTVPIQSPGAKQCRKGRIWCYLGDEANPYTVYDYTPSRARAGPAKWLSGYEGYLQADAYGGYDGIFHSQNVTEVACWRMRGGSSTTRRTPTKSELRRCCR